MASIDMKEIEGTSNRLRLIEFSLMGVGFRRAGPACDGFELLIGQFHAFVLGKLHEITDVADLVDLGDLVFGQSC